MLTRRRYARVVLAVLVGAGLIGALGVSGMRPEPNPLVAGPNQVATYGDEHVGIGRAYASESLFPSRRRGHGHHAALMRAEGAPRHNAPLGDWSR